MARRVAILVLAHLTAPLPFLLRALGDRFDVYLHLDAKTDAGGLVLPRHVTAIARREVHWGGWSMMQATMDLMAAARDHDVLALVSGDSLPLLAPDALHAALTIPGAERIEMLEVADDPTLAGMPREAAIARHGWEQPWRFHNFVHWDDVLLNPFGAAAAARHFDLAAGKADWLRGAAQRLVAEALSALPPRPRLFPRLVYGTQWWALAGETVAGLLPELTRPEVTAYFRFFPVPDEHMIHTVLAARQPGLVARRSPMWRSGDGAVLDRAAIRRARRQGGDILFARKFDPAAAPALAAAILAGKRP
ncbi:MAG: hypothetical protein IT555_11060 [Acetobacteraceae bacterium]|nr:hypothetical protein [Acetobacteraceae bacterium]